MDYKIACTVPITSKVRACVDIKELLEIIDKHGDIDPIKVHMSQGRIMQQRAFAVANWL
jgi:hypothetical protein